jgi:NhaP-type Na+/H+ or K+/H+ antiporter
MEPGAASLILATVFLWSLGSARLAAVSTPIIFVAAGLIYSEVLGVLDLTPDPHLVKGVAEITLVWVLFADASRIKPHEVRADLGLYVRLLGVGLPLTVGLGMVGAMALLDMDPWHALLLGAALAPTDAALGSAVMSDRRVPRRVRQALNVESGLNDGIATPIVFLAVAGIAAESDIAGLDGPGGALLGLLVGALAGIVLGGAGGFLMRQAHHRGWSSEELAGPAVLALSLLAYMCAVLVDANGFVAAFVGGIAFGATAGRGGDKEVYYVEQTCGLASMLSWLVFGAVAVPMLPDHVSWQLVLYAVASLTVVRMIPVAVALVGAHLDLATTAFVGWFGPRGLASIVFALIALEDLHGHAAEVVSAVCLTVLFSVVAHGLSAKPLAGRYAATQRDAVATAHAEPTVRRFAGRSKPPAREWSPASGDGGPASGSAG